MFLIKITMNKIILYIVFGMSILAFGCKKAELTTENSPIFLLEGNMDSLPYKAEAGVNEKYMLSTFYLSPDSTKYIYRGNLGVLKSPYENQAEQLIIDLIQAKGTIASDVNSSVKKGGYQFATSDFNSDIAALQFISNLSGFAPYQINLSFDSIKNDQIEGIIPLQNPNYIGQAVVEATDNLGRVSSQILWLNLEAGVISGVSISKDGNVLTAHSFGENPLSYNWSNQGGNDSIAILDSAFVQKIWTVSVKLSNGQTVSNSIDFSKNSDFPFNVSMNMHKIYINNPNGPTVRNFENGSVIVQLRDADGQVYSSDFVDQPSTSYFNIINVDDFEENEAGIPTKMLDVDFNCVLNNSDRTLQKKLSGFKGKIAVGYPK